MPLVPPGRLLVTSDGDWFEGVAIPDLEHRLHELPPPEQPVLVVGEQASQTVDWLRAGGRDARIVDEHPRSSRSPNRPNWRLWQPNMWLEEMVSGMRPGSVLDMGCGSGRDSVFLSESGWSVCAVDLLEDSIQRAQDLERRYGSGDRVKWQVGDAHQAPQMQFDLIIMLRCYLPSLLLEASEGLAPGGTVLVQSFTEVHRERTGRPTNPRYIFRQEDVPSRFMVQNSFCDEKWQYVQLRRDL